MSDYDAFFNEADANGNGFLTMEELVALLNKKGYKGSEEDLAKYFDACDRSDDGKICKEEYLIAMGQIPDTEHKKASMRQVFKSFDQDGSGQITKSDLKIVFEEMGKSFSEDELARMIAQADVDGDGDLDYDEFIDACF